jgi:hypothetical protein
MKLEEFSDMEDEEDPVPMSFMEIKFEREVSCMCVCLLLGIAQSHPELPILIPMSSVAKKKISRTRRSVAVEAYPVSCNDSITMTDKAMMVLQDSLDSQKDVPGSHSEACVSPSHDRDEAVSIKVEELSHAQYEEPLVPMTVVEIKVEPEVSCVCVSTVKHLSVTSRST